jgi:site-specific DNA-methyltransferase (adenine-specific)
VIENYINKVIQGDSAELLKEFPDKSVDLIVCDPPYGMDFQSNYRQIQHDKIANDKEFPVWIFDEFFRIAKRGVYVFCRWDNLGSVPAPKSVIAWVKNNWSMGDLLHEHGRQWEACLFYPQEGHEFITRIPDVIHATRTGNNLHPTEKPIELMKTIIDANVGEIVLDPFAGSGSTLVACKQLGRKYIGIELSQKYCDIANERLAQDLLF